MKRLAVVGVVVANLAFAALLTVWLGHRTDRPADPAARASAAPVDMAWAGLSPQARCDVAAALVTQPAPWPTICRGRTPTDALQGQSFPPPKGPPPYDDPHIEIYVDPSQSPGELAHAIAHELGHMRHTREPTFAPAWLAARGLPADTPAEVWTEDYAETFAALFAPPSGMWRAPTPRPSPEALAGLRSKFFA